MEKQTYIIYEKTNPFIGYIRFHGKVDPNQTPDGSTLYERLVILLDKYPDTGLYLFSLDTLVNPEKQKFDIATDTLVALDSEDITPIAQKALNKIQRETDIIDGLPSWEAVKGALDSIRSEAADASTLAQLKTALAPLLNFVEKHARITYWLAKNEKD